MRFDDKEYRRVLVVTDLDDGRVFQRASIALHSEASVALLTAYQIPFGGLHALLAEGRLLRELEALAIEKQNAFVRTSRIERARVELLARHGDLRDVVRTEVHRWAPDLVVVALEARTWLARYLLRRLKHVLAIGSFDVLVCSCGVRTCTAALWRNELLALGPW